MEQRVVSLLQTTLNSGKLKQLHTLIIKQYHGLTSLFLNSLASNPSTIQYACKVFDAIPLPDVALCNSVISALSKLSFHRETLQNFFSLQSKGIQLTFYSFPPVLKACAAISAIIEGKQIHSLVLASGYSSNIFIQTGLIDLYAKSGDLDSAKRIFYEILVKDPVPCNCLITGCSKLGRVAEARQIFDGMPVKTPASWNTMISCYAHHGDMLEALNLFERMQKEKVRPNEITLVTILSISAKLGDLEIGLKVKKLMENYNLCTNIIVRTALLEMYVKCGAIDEGRKVFDQIGQKDVVAWSTMITGYAQNGRPNEALGIFEEMKVAGCKPNDVTLVGALSACAQLGSAEVGGEVGKYVESRASTASFYVASALLDMYAKCGNVARACLIFEQMQHKDIVSWNSIIGGLAVNGHAKDAIGLYHQMIEQNLEPNDITFVGLLTACSHAGLVDLGLKYFNSLKAEHNITPKVEHYSCIVDLLCRSNRLEDAFAFICKMEVEPNVAIWGTLLSACRVHCNVELAEYAVERLLVLEPSNSSNYILLSNIYADAGKWEEARKMRNLMRDKNVQKLAGCSWIELDNIVHKFLVQDVYHPRSDEIYNTVDGIGLQLKWAGYAPDSDLELLLHCADYIVYA